MPYQVRPSWPALDVDGGMRTANGLPGFEIAISESFGKADRASERGEKEKKLLYDKASQLLRYASLPARILD